MLGLCTVQGRCLFARRCVGACERQSEVVVALSGLHASLDFDFASYSSSGFPRGPTACCLQCRKQLPFGPQINSKAFSLLPRQSSLIVSSCYMRRELAC